MRKFAAKFFGLAFLLALLPPTPARASAPVMVLDPTLSQDEMADWLGYSGARSAYREQHKLPSPSSGEIIPTFDEEISARSIAAAFSSTMNSRNSYWAAVEKVQSAGFLKEYVWTYLRRPSWPANQAPKNLAAFEKWRRINLKNHKPETRAKLMAK